jgi:hypothetical protein
MATNMASSGVIKNILQNANIIDDFSYQIAAKKKNRYEYQGKCLQPFHFGWAIDLSVVPRGLDCICVIQNTYKVMCGFDKSTST